MNGRKFDPTSSRDLATLLEALGIFLGHGRRPAPGGAPRHPLDFHVATRRNGYHETHSLEEVLDHCEDVVEMVLNLAGTYEMRRVLELYREVTGRDRRASPTPPVPTGLEKVAKMIPAAPTPPSAADLEAAATSARRLLDDQAAAAPLTLPKAPE